MVYEGSGNLREDAEAAEEELNWESKKSKLREGTET